MSQGWVVKCFISSDLSIRSGVKQGKQEHLWKAHPLEAWTRLGEYTIRKRRVHLHDHAIGTFAYICQISISRSNFEWLTSNHFHSGPLGHLVRHFVSLAMSRCDWWNLITCHLTSSWSTSAKIFCMRRQTRKEYGRFFCERWDPKRSAKPVIIMFWYAGLCINHWPMIYCSHDRYG